MFLNVVGDSARRIYDFTASRSSGSPDRRMTDIVAIRFYAMLFLQDVVQGTNLLGRG